MAATRLKAFPARPLYPLHSLSSKDMLIHLTCDQFDINNALIDFLTDESNSERCNLFIRYIFFVDKNPSQQIQRILSHSNPAVVDFFLAFLSKEENEAIHELTLHLLDPNLNPQEKFSCPMKRPLNYYYSIKKDAVSAYSIAYTLDLALDLLKNYLFHSQKSIVALTALYLQRKNNKQFTMKVFSLCSEREWIQLLGSDMTCTAYLASNYLAKPALENKKNNIEKSIQATLNNLSVNALKILHKNSSESERKIATTVFTSVKKSEHDPLLEKVQTIKNSCQFIIQNAPTKKPLWQEIVKISVVALTLIGLPIAALMTVNLLHRQYYGLGLFPSPPDHLTTEAKKFMHRFKA